MWKVKKKFEKRLFLLICRAILGFVFIYASIDKILDPEAFAQILHNYKLLPDFLIYPPALILPWVELIAGSFLVAGIFVRGSSFIINLLLIIFIHAIAFNLLRGISFDCGCFSLSAGTGSNAYLLLLRDLLLLIPGILIYYNYSRNRSLNESKN